MQQKSKKITAVALILVFTLPVILAKLALENEWFNKGATNKGQLLDPIIEAGSLFIIEGDEPHWRLAYIVPDLCDAACENAIFSISQVRTALGRKMDRVDAVFVVTENSDVKAVKNLEITTFGKLLKTNLNNVNNLFKQTGNNGIFLVDTLGNVVLRFDTTLEREQAIMDSRDILADLRKLLKLSRIG
ncbi:MAG: hypothetical protein ACI89W_001429 [Gammaproteobacteria bacterium]|jgi:hypothetical protein